jgi:hypothetical protein
MPGVDRELPVRGHAHLARVDAMQRREPERLELRSDPAQRVLGIEVAARCRQHEQQSVALVRRQRGERAVIEAQRFERSAVGQSGQPALVVVGPRVPWAYEPAAAPAALRHARTAVSARVDERAEHSVFAAHEQHRNARDLLARKAPGLGQVARQTHDLGELEEQAPALVLEALGIDVAGRVELDGGSRRASSSSPSSRSSNARAIAIRPARSKNPSVHRH